MPIAPKQPGYTDLWKRSVASDPAMISIEDDKARFAQKNSATQSPATEPDAAAQKSAAPQAK